jgi:hypothetical protein
MFTAAPANCATPATATRPRPFLKDNQAFLFSAHTIAFIPKTLWRDGLAGSGSFPMRKSGFVLAVIGAACSSVAFAGEVKQTKAAAPVVKATTMSDAQMDKVIAGSAANPTPGGGNDTACTARGTCASPAATNSQAPFNAHVSVSPGEGRGTR